MTRAATEADSRLGERGASARIAVTEPQGERIFDSRLAIGGDGADIVVPGAGAGAALRIERQEAVWTAQALDGARVALDGRLLGGARALRHGDVLAVGRAQVVVAELSRNALRLDVRHVVGNATVAPATLLASADHDDENVDIVAEPFEPEAASRHGSETTRPRWQRWRSLARRHWVSATAVTVPLAIAAFISTFEPVALVAQPSDAHVRASDTWLALRSGNQIFLMPGTHELYAQRAGYVPARVPVVVHWGHATSARVLLRKLPGRLQIDTEGITATVSVDGVQVGSAPGVMPVQAGQHTLALRAPRYLDYVTTLDIKGAGALQVLKARLHPSWGTLVISTHPSGAHLSVDGREQALAPATVQLDAGVHLIELSSPGLKSWESRIVIEAGETLQVGAITLGQPDAQLLVRSQPEGADVAVARNFRGKTPLTLSLPSGIEHEVSLSLPGYESWTRTVLAEPAKRLTLDAPLSPIYFEVSVRGVPAGAEVRVDGAPRGRTPEALELLAVEHRIEVQKRGYVPLIANVSPTPGLASAVQYRLVVSDRSLAYQQSAPTISTQSGYVLRIVPSGVFLMDTEASDGDTGGDGQEVRFARPFYIGIHEVTDAEFREFHADHAALEPSPFGPRAPVTEVSWDDAVEYCNWLSRRERLEPAYQRSGGTYVLKIPVTTGYRLPTEAEWAYAARESLAGALGSYTLSGSISEWVNDFYQMPDDSIAATDPLGPVWGVRHVVRAWNGSSARDERWTVRREGGDGASETVGFRIARYAE